MNLKEDIDNMKRLMMLVGALALTTAAATMAEDKPKADTPKTAIEIGKAKVPDKEVVIKGGQNAEAKIAEAKKGGSQVETKSGLKYTDEKVGTGDVAVAGMKVAVHYTGWLDDGGKKGKKFDSSVDRGQPFTFALGAGQVIKGWDEGVAGMKVGGKRTLVIPPDLGYGAKGAGGVIPGNSTLIFDVELLKVTK